MKKTKYTIVAPCFENNNHRSGLDQNTRLRLIAAVYLYKKGKIDIIIVGGGKFRQMKESFSNLMKGYLIKKGVPSSIISTEEYTFDTASQVYWVSERINGDHYIYFITDSEQKKHLDVLVSEFSFDSKVVSMEEIIKQYDGSKHIVKFLKKFKNSFGWKMFVIREFLLTVFTLLFDPRNEKLGKITRRRRN